MIPGGQVISEPCGAMDVFPTMLQAAGGRPEDYQLDGQDIMKVMTEGADSPHKEIYWEMDGQTAVRQGNYKLVLNGVLVEGEPVQDPVFLSDLSEDPSESKNLAQELPELTKELTEKALKWRAELEDNWEKNFASNYRSLT